jgi:hypothetical protein
MACLSGIPEYRSGTDGTKFQTGVEQGKRCFRPHAGLPSGFSSIDNDVFTVNMTPFPPAQK